MSAALDSRHPKRLDLLLAHCAEAAPRRKPVFERLREKIGVELRAEDERGAAVDADGKPSEPDVEPEDERPDEGDHAARERRSSKVHGADSNRLGDRSGLSTSCTPCCGNVDN